MSSPWKSPTFPSTTLSGVGTVDLIDAGVLTCAGRETWLKTTRSSSGVGARGRNCRDRLIPDTPVLQDVGPSLGRGSSLTRGTARPGISPSSRDAKSDEVERSDVMDGCGSRGGTSAGIMVDPAGFFQISPGLSHSFLL